MPVMANKIDSDDFAVDTPEDPNVEVEIIKNVKKLKEEKAVAGAPRRMTKVRYVDPLSQLGKAEEQLYKRLTILKTFKTENILRFRFINFYPSRNQYFIEASKMMETPSGR